MRGETKADKQKFMNDNVPPVTGLGSEGGVFGCYLRVLHATGLTVGGAFFLTIANNLSLACQSSILARFMTPRSTICSSVKVIPVFNQGGSMYEYTSGGSNFLGLSRDVVFRTVLPTVLVFRLAPFSGTFCGLVRLFVVSCTRDRSVVGWGWLLHKVRIAQALQVGRRGGRRCPLGGGRGVYCCPSGGLGCAC